VLRHIPQLRHLQSLSIKGISRFDAATLVGMTQLLCLLLTEVPVDAASLGSMPHLQELVLYKCHTEAPAASAAAAIGQLSALKVLKVLQWRPANGYGSLFDGAPLNAFSALTASSQLQRLHVNCIGEHGYRSSVPDSAVAHMFPPGRLLQHLVFLQICPDKPKYHRRHRDDTSDNGLSNKDLQCMASSCPALQSLHLKGSLKAGQALDALLQLSECRSLSIGGSDDEWSNAAAAVVAQMTQLTHLSCFCSKGFNGLGLQLLTALTNLQRLEIAPMFCDGYSGGQDCLMEMDLQVTLDSENCHLTVLDTQVGKGLVCKGNHGA
jgi:hypothetical protein